MSIYDGAPYGDGEWGAADPVAEPCADPCARTEVALEAEVVPDSVAEPLFEEPVYEEPVYEEPLYEEPLYDEPAIEDAVVEEPVFAEASYEDQVFVDPAVPEPELPAPVGEPVTNEWVLPEEPVVYEHGTLITQEPLAEDLVTVEDITQTAVYREWEAATGGFDLGLDPGAVQATGSLQATGAFASPGMVGDAGDVNFWFQQNSQFSCGPSSVAQILSDFTGIIHADESVVAARAQQLGWYDPSSGMLPQNVANLLDDQGVPSTMHRDQSFDHIEQYLREGRAVVMFLDARDVMPAMGYEDYVAADELENSAQDTVDHFVRVIGIDQAAGIAIIANPGYAGASQVEIPLAQLEEAWNDNVIRSDTQIDRARILIVSDGGDPTPDDATTRAPGEVVLEPNPPVTPGPGTVVEPEPLPPIDPDPVPVPVGNAATPDPELPGPPATPEPPDPAEVAGRPVAAERPVRSGDVDLPDPDGQRRSAPPRPRIVELPTDGRSFLLPATPPAAPAEVSLPADPAAIAAPTESPARDVGSDDEGASPFSAVPGWVLIPVTLAAGRIGAALRDAKK